MGELRSPRAVVARRCRSRHRRSRSVGHLPGVVGPRRRSSSSSLVPSSNGSINDSFTCDIRRCARCRHVVRGCCCVGCGHRARERPARGRRRNSKHVCPPRPPGPSMNRSAGAPWTWSSPEFTRPETSSIGRPRRPRFKYGRRGSAFFALTGGWSETHEHDCEHYRQNRLNG